MSKQDQPILKKCPLCGEEVLAVAVRCKHCGGRLGTTKGLRVAVVVSAILAAAVVAGLVAREPARRYLAYRNAMKGMTDQSKRCADLLLKIDVKKAVAVCDSLANVCGTTIENVYRNKLNSDARTGLEYTQPATEMFASTKRARYWGAMLVFEFARMRRKQMVSDVGLTEQQATELMGHLLNGVDASDEN